VFPVSVSSLPSALPQVGYDTRPRPNRRGAPVDRRPAAPPGRWRMNPRESPVTISMYQVSIPRFVHMLGNLATILDKAQAYAEAKKIDAKVLPASRLFPDMLPLTSQVRIACDTAKRAAAMLAGVDNPVYEDNETTIPELKARVEKTIAFLNTIRPAQIDGTEGKEIVVKVGGQDTPFKGMQFLLARAIPNFYFHVTTAYDILRHNGLDVGKKDFLGNTTAS
jgi:hypothetical protein